MDTYEISILALWVLVLLLAANGLEWVAAGIVSVVAIVKLYPVVRAVIAQLRQGSDKVQYCACGRMATVYTVDPYETEETGDDTLAGWYCEQCLEAVNNDR